MNHLNRSFKNFIRSGRRVLLAAAALALAALLLLATRRLARRTAHALMPPPPPRHDYDYLRRSRDLGHYATLIDIPLIEPSTVTCEREATAVVALVSSAPRHVEERDAVRSTWGRHMPTYFFLGLSATHAGDLNDNYIEAKESGDLVVAEFQDSYDNLTLKTAFMLRWSRRRCPKAAFVLKTDDDVLVDPWALRALLKDHANASLIGYKIMNSVPHRDEYTKWYLPRWLYSYDVIPEYLSGTAYLINVSVLSRLWKAALEEPLVPLEDVYWSWLVARRRLSLRLQHDARLAPSAPPSFSPSSPLSRLSRLSPFSPFSPPSAAAHSLSADQLRRRWRSLVDNTYARSQSLQ